MMKRKVLLFIILLCMIISNDVYAVSRTKAKLSKCVDGDTAKLIIKGKEEKVRFLAINTPEYEKKVEEYYGKESSEYTCKKLSNAKTIELEYDPKSEERDKYGRILAWIYVDDKLLQEELVKKGYAEIKYVYDDYLYVEKLKKLEEKAKEKKLGIWNENEKNNEEIDEKEQILSFIKDILEKISKKVLEKVENML